MYMSPPQLNNTPQLLAEFIQYKHMSKKMSMTHRHPPTEQHPTIVGRLYPMQIHFSKNVHSPTLCSKGTQTPPNWTTFSNCWQHISNTLCICVFLYRELISYGTNVLGNQCPREPVSQGTNVPGNQSPMELISGGTNCLDSIGLAPDLLDWHWLSMDWHWICNELTPRWWGLAAHWLLIYISLTINMVLTLDWYQIGTRFASDWQWIDNELVLKWYWIDAQLVGLARPIVCGLAMD